MELLRCEGVTRRPFFQDVHLSVGAGEIVVLQGPTGSGKTLFLRAVADLDPADAGDFHVEERAREDFTPPAWRRTVLYVHQSAPRLPGTVQANLARIRALGETPPDGVPALPDLDPARDATRLSGGEAQLLSLTRALTVGPRVLLLDESTSALDADRAQRVEEVLVRWVAGGRGILWVTHEEALADRVGARRVRFP